jgi:hypothetical protein
MARMMRLARLMGAGLALASASAGCAASTPGASLQMMNNTPVTVTMKSCPAELAKAQQCTDIARIRPDGSETFPLRAESRGSVVRLVVITGYQRLPRCFEIPPIFAHVWVKVYVIRAKVTDADNSSCMGAVVRPSPAG